MTWERALLDSIELKWEKICFGGVYAPCALCLKEDTSSCSSSCPLAKFDKSCNAGSLYSKTTLNNGNFRERPSDADYIMYLFLCLIYHECYGNE